MSKDAGEQFWLGEQRTQAEVVVLKMQNETEEKRWFSTLGGTSLDPGYSEYSVRLYDPDTPSLSFIHRTLAILPKSRVRAIHKLLGAYIHESDEEAERGKS
jgi:phosphatidylethanolamine-binding protein (PEBP) family uncharacterized protein